MKEKLETGLSKGYLENVMLQWDDRIANVEGFLGSLEKRFVEDVLKRPRYDDAFAEQRLQAIEHQLRFLSDIVKGLYDDVKRLRTAAQGGTDQEVGDTTGNP